MATKTKIIQTVYEVSSGDIKIRVYVHGPYIEIVDENLDPKPFTFATKDSPAKRKLWLEVLKTLQMAIKNTPTIGKE